MRTSELRQVFRLRTSPGPSSRTGPLRAMRSDKWTGQRSSPSGPVAGSLRRRVRGGFSPPSLFSLRQWATTFVSPWHWTPHSPGSVPATGTAATAYGGAGSRSVAGRGVRPERVIGATPTLASLRYALTLSQPSTSFSGSELRQNEGPREWASRPLPSMLLRLIDAALAESVVHRAEIRSRSS